MNRSILKAKMNLIELPEDILGEICNFLDLQSVLRFGLTAKVLFRSWKLSKKLSTDICTQEKLDWVAKQDLSHLQEVGLSFKPGKNAGPLKLLNLVTLVYASNLRNLSMNFMHSENATKTEQLQCIWPLVSVFTQLHELTVLYEKMIVHCEYLARNEHLTSLTLTLSMTQGLTALTTLKELKLKMTNGVPKSVLEEIARLTNLESLDTEIDVQDHFQWLSRMTNLQKLALGRLSSPEIRVISRLPKLTSFKFKIPSDIADDFDFSLLGNFTNLTLDVFSLYNVEALTRLTNLVNLTIFGNIFDDFSCFKRMTRLEMILMPHQLSKLQLVFPSNLKTLIFHSPLHNADITHAICNCNTLRELSLAYTLRKETEMLLIEQISKLSNLVHLQLPEVTTTDLIGSGLTSLPNLVRLNMAVSSYNIQIAQEVTRLTQLLSFTYWSDEPELFFHLQAPFVVRCEKAPRL